MQLLLFLEGLKFQWVPVDISPGVKWPGCETDHSPPPSAKIKNGEAMLLSLRMSS
jgi:hypothetical protein